MGAFLIFGLLLGAILYVMSLWESPRGGEAEPGAPPRRPGALRQAWNGAVVIGLIGGLLAASFLIATWLNR